jgi:hypothetical protein
MVTGWITGDIFLSGTEIILFVTLFTPLSLTWFSHVIKAQKREAQNLSTSNTDLPIWSFVVMPLYDFIA